MKRILLSFIALFGLLQLRTAQAITYANGTWEGPNNTSITLTGTFAVGDLIVFGAEWNALPGAGVSGVVFSDTLNSGSYTLLENHIESGQGRQYFGGYIVVNTPGATLTLSSSQLSGYASGSIFIAHYNGFSGTATATGDVSLSFNSSSASTAVAGTSFNTSQANELVSVPMGNILGSNMVWATAPASPWVNESPLNNLTTLSDQIVATSGTAVQLTGTLSSTQLAWVVQMGFYDHVTVTNFSAGFLGQ